MENNFKSENKEECYFFIFQHFQTKWINDFVFCFSKAAAAEINFEQSFFGKDVEYGVSDVLVCTVCGNVIKKVNKEIGSKASRVIFEWTEIWFSKL